MGYELLVADAVVVESLDYDCNAGGAHQAEVGSNATRHLPSPQHEFI